VTVTVKGDAIQQPAGVEFIAGYVWTRSVMAWAQLAAAKLGDVTQILDGVAQCPPPWSYPQILVLLRAAGSVLAEHGRGDMGAINVSGRLPHLR